MIELSNGAALTLAPGQTANFDRILVNTRGCTILTARPSAGTIRMAHRGIYELAFAGNITGATAATAVTLAIAINGTPLPETNMSSVPAAAGDLNNVSTHTYVPNGYEGYSTVSLVNNGTAPVTIGENSVFTVRKIG